MTVALADTFNVGNIIDALPVGWTLSGSAGSGWWSIKAAPSWANQAIAQGLLLKATSEFLNRSFTAAGSGTTVRMRAGTDGVNTERCGFAIFQSGGTDCFGFLFYSDGNLYLTNMATADVTLVTGYAANTLYDMSVVIGASGAITSSKINGTAKGGGTMNNSHTSISSVKIDAFNGNIGTASGHAQVDMVLVDSSTAVPNGTISASGTLDGNTLGPDNYGGVVIGYTNGANVASTIYKLERSSDGGTTWASIGFNLTATASGFLIWDGRPQYGSQTVSPGSTATYRVTASNATGDQVL